MYGDLILAHAVLDYILECKNVIHKSHRRSEPRLVTALDHVSDQAETTEKKRGEYVGSNMYERHSSVILAFSVIPFFIQGDDLRSSSNIPCLCQQVL